MSIASISAVASVARPIESRGGKTQSSDPATQAFQKADVQQARQRMSVELSSAGKPQAEGAAPRELSANGNIGRSVNTLTSRANAPESQQAERQAQAAAAQQAISEKNARLDTNVHPGIAAYLKIFSI